MEADQPLEIIFFVNRTSMIRGDLAVKIYANISLFKLLLIFLTVLYLETTIFLLLGLNSAIACRENQLFRVAPV